MKKSIKRILSVLCAVVMTALSVPFSLVQAQAFGSISYALNPDGQSYCVSDCDDNYFGRAKIQATYSGLPVTKIASKAFDNSDIYEVVIPESVTVIDTYAFSGCEKLRSVVFSGGVTEIKANAFSMCISLRTISFPESLKSIDDYAFSGCTALKNIYFEGNKTEISVYSDLGTASGATIYAYANSSAEKFALNNNISFSSIICEETVINTPQSTQEGILLTWNKVSNASGYKVYRRTKNETEWTHIGTVSGTRFVDSDVSEACEYIYTVNAYNKYEDGESNIAGVDAMYLKAPVLKSATSSEKGVTVKWEAVKGAEEYNVYRKTFFSKWIKIATTDDTSFTDKTAKKGKRYTYTVEASAKVYRTTVKSFFNKKGLAVKVNYLATPEIESAYMSANNEITVTWTANEGAKHYLVYRSVKSDSGFTEVAKVKTNSFTDKNVEFNKKYYYKVITVDRVQSEASPVKEKKASVPSPVIDTKIFVTPKKVTITWGKVSGASGYCVYRYNTSKSNWTKITTLKGDSSVTYTDNKTGKNKYKVCAYKTVSGKDYIGESSKVLTTYTFSKPELTVRQYGSGFVNEVSWTPVSGATGYLLYYKVGGNGQWTRAAVLSSRITSYRMDVTNGKYYHWRVRPIYENNGFTVGGSYSNTDDIMIYFTPSIRVTVSNDKVENAQKVSVTVENKGVCPLRVLKDGAYIYNGTKKPDCNGTISLIDSNSRKIEYKDIAPGKTETISFLIDGAKKGYYDGNTLIQFYFTYDTMKYILQTDPTLTGSQARYQLA